MSDKYGLGPNDYYDFKGQINNSRIQLFLNKIFSKVNKKSTASLARLATLMALLGLDRCASDNEQAMLPKDDQVTTIISEETKPNSFRTANGKYFKISLPSEPLTTMTNVSHTNSIDL